MAETDDTKTDDSKTDTDDESTKGTDDTGSTSTDTDDGGEDDADAEKWKSLSRKHEREAAKLRSENEKLLERTRTDAEKETAKAVREAEERVRGEMLGEMVTTALAAAAKSKLADPSYVRLLEDDVRETFTSDGKVDHKAIDKALDGLVKTHPNLAPSGRAGALPGGDKKTGSSGFDINADIRRKAGRG